MSTQPSSTIPVPTLKCKYPDCLNEWIPRSTKLPKVCPRCKRYGWETGRTLKRIHKGGKHGIRSTTRGTHIGPETERFLEQRLKQRMKKET